ncbi:MAG TPA: hypothetical protein VGU67_14315 [Edaphobacter sp.]|nr:hypothetical protein [Edaphobacter sp.]
MKHDNAEPGDRLLLMDGPTLQERLDILIEHLAEAERRFAAGEPYPDHTGGSWPERIAKIKQHIADLREIIANE